jgi:hypothetical protein
MNVETETAEIAIAIDDGAQGRLLIAALVETMR